MSHELICILCVWESWWVVKVKMSPSGGKEKVNSHQSFRPFQCYFDVLKFLLFLLSPLALFFSFFPSFTPDEEQTKEWRQRRSLYVSCPPGCRYSPLQVRTPWTYKGGCVCVFGCVVMWNIATASLNTRLFPLFTVFLKHQTSNLLSILTKEHLVAVGDLYNLIIMFYIPVYFNAKAC